jgi:hypothetical protein
MHATANANRPLQYTLVVVLCKGTDTLAGQSFSAAPHVCLQDHLLPALQDQHKAALACTCSALRVLIQQRVTTLKLFAGQCCRVHDDRLAGKLPAVTALRLRPGNLHEALFVLPIFFMQVI